MKILRQDGERFVPVTSERWVDENELQELIERDPGILPIKLDPRREIVREFATPAGPMDHLVLDAEARIVVVETKLARNSTRRAVIAQAIDYTTQLSKLDGPGLLEQVQRSLGRDVLEGWFETAAERGTWENVVTSKLKRGQIDILIMMDEASDLLKDAVRFLNRETPFNLLLGEVRTMQIGEHRVLGLDVYGAESAAEKAPGVRSSSPPLNDDMFLEAVGKLSAEAEGRTFLAAIRWASERDYPVRRTPRTMMLGHASQESLQWYVDNPKLILLTASEKVGEISDALSNVGAKWQAALQRKTPAPGTSYGVVAEFEVGGMQEADFRELFSWYADVRGFDEPDAS